MKSKNKILKIIGFVAMISIVTVLATFLIQNLYVVFTTPQQYLITSENYFDYQQYNECAGYSSAYVLRHLGIDADGLEVYNKISNKNPDGTVPPTNLTSFLIEEGYSAKLYSGSVWQLKHEISMGTPVIVFVRVAPDLNYYHYLPIVGYDEENLFTAESLSNMKNVENEYYNRIISNQDFEEMWETGVTLKNTYITISQE